MFRFSFYLYFGSDAAGSAPEICKTNSNGLAAVIAY